MAMEGESKDGAIVKGKEVSECGEDWNCHKANVWCDDEFYSADHSRDLNLSPNSVLDLSSLPSKVARQLGKDWWWKQDGSGELCSKDYVREWIGSQIHASNPHWLDEQKSTPVKPECGSSLKRMNKLEDRNESALVESRLDTLEQEFEKEKNDGGKRKKKKKKKHRKMQEWWKEEHLDEMNVKGCVNSDKKMKILKTKLKKGLKVPHFDVGRRFYFCQWSKFRESKILDGEAEGEFSFRRGWRRKSNNNNNSNKRSMGSEMWSGDLLSRELSSTTSMRGTLCYVAPEYGGCGYLMEKGDIYSFGVLVLVIISGRRPLHVLASPMKLEKANLVSWCRHLAQSGNILELVDEKLKDEYSKEQASLCINLALICLQKMPELRPDIGEVVRILKGETEIPPASFEFSPSPPSKFYKSRSRRKIKGNAEQ